MYRSRLAALAVALSGILAAPSAFADPEADACANAPTRACVLEAAAAAAKHVSTPYLEANLLAITAREQHRAGLADAAAATLALAVEANQHIPADYEFGVKVPGIVAAQAEMGDVAGALVLARSIEISLPREAALAGIAMVQQRQGRPEDARATFVLALEAATAAAAERRSVLITQVAVSEAQVGSPDAAATFDLALAAAIAGPEKSAVTYVIGQRIKSGDFARALIDISGLSDSSQGHLTSALVAAATFAGQADDAAAVATLMPSGILLVRSYCNVAVAQFRAGHAVAAAQWILKAQTTTDEETTAGVKAENEAELAGAEAVAGLALRSTAHFDDARSALAAKVIDPVFLDAIAGALARALARNGDTQAALDVLTNRFDPNLVTFHIGDIAADLVAAHHWGPAFLVLSAMPIAERRAGALLELAGKLPG